MLGCDLAGRVLELPRRIGQNGAKTYVLDRLAQIIGSCRYRLVPVARRW
jgi:hypothetical protein